MRIKFITFGCKVNQYETQALKEKFEKLGCLICEEKPDLCVINGCSVTANADRKSKEALARAKKENPKAKIVACGCFAQLPGSLSSKHNTDYVIPQSKKHLLPEIVLGLVSEQKQPTSESVWSLRVSCFSNQRAFIKVQDGCSNYCAFCKIPYLRGPSCSRKLEDVLAEIKVISKLHNEVVLCGINLGLYGRDLTSQQTLNSLLIEILNLSLLGRVRISSLESYSFDYQLLSHFSQKKLCPHLHLSFQYGDNSILKAMNKQESVELYEDIVDQARKIKPNIALSCDIMVGFPGENDKSFQNTLDFLRRVKPMRTHIFSFSPREKTLLCNAKITDRKKIRQRYKIIKQLTDHFAVEYMSGFVGNVLEVIGEEETSGFVSGYTENYLRVYVEPRISLGKIVPVKIKKIADNKLFAYPV